MDNKSMQESIKKLYKDYKMQAVLWTLIVSVFAIFFFESDTSASIESHWQSLVYKLLAALLALLVLHALNAILHILFGMPLAAPRAMLDFSLALLEVHFFAPLLAHIRRVKISCLIAQNHREPHHSYSLASLFSISIFPYRLYPLTCSLLE